MVVHQISSPFPKLFFAPRDSCICMQCRSVLSVKGGDLNPLGRLFTQAICAVVLWVGIEFWPDTWAGRGGLVLIGMGVNAFVAYRAFVFALKLVRS
jgi:hypothetical protein